MYLNLRLDAILNNLSDERTDILKKVKEIYLSVTGNECDGDCSFKDIPKEETEQIIDRALSFFNIDKTPEAESIGSISELVDYIEEHDGTPVSNDLFMHWDSQNIQKGLEQLDTIINYLNIAASQENIGDSVLKFFANIADVFIGIVNTFKTNIFKFYKSVKRCEMRTFYETHTLLCKRVESTEYTKFMNMTISIPTGMLMSFTSAIVFVNNTYQQIDVSSFTEYFYKEIIDIRHKICNSRFDYTSVFAPSRQLSGKTQSIESVIREQAKLFSDKTGKAFPKFKDFYASMTEFKNVREDLMDMESRLCDTSKMVSSVDSISAALGDITAYMSSDAKLNTAFVTQLAESVRTLGTLLDVYGQTATRQMSLEHNHILNYINAYKLI